MYAFFKIAYTFLSNTALPTLFRFGLLPYRKPINVVVGTPIPVTKVENPTRDQVNQVHAVYIEALKKLYQEFNPVHGDPKVDLVIN